MQQRYRKIEIKEISGNSRWCQNFKTIKTCVIVFLFEKKMSKIERTLYKKKVLSPKYFFKNQNCLRNSRSKVLKILRNEPFALKTAKNHCIHGKT